MCIRLWSEAFFVKSIFKEVLGGFVLAIVGSLFLYMFLLAFPLPLHFSICIEFEVPLVFLFNIILIAYQKRLCSERKTN